MMRLKNRRRWLRTGHSGLIPGCLLAGLLLLPAAGYCADTDTQQIVEQAAEKAAEKAVEKATGLAVEAAAEKAAVKAVEKAAQHAAEETTAEVVEKAAERALEKTAQEAAAKQEIKARRPDERRGATKVGFVVFVLDIDAIDAANQSFMANVYIRLRWKDSRHANPQGATRQIHLDEIWNPQLVLANRQGLVSRSLPELVQVDPDGTVTYRQRYSGLVSQPLQLANFPMDAHEFTIHFASVAYSDEEVEFFPDVDNYSGTSSGGAIADKLSLPDWKITGYEALALPYQPIKVVHSAGFAFRFQAKRYVEYYLWQVLLPLSVVVMMSWAGFWVQRDQIGVRIGIATSSILTLIAHRFILASLLPRLPYMTRLDYFSVVSTLLVFLALLVVVMTSYLAATSRTRIAKSLDLWARGAFPAAYLLLLGWFMSG